MFSSSSHNEGESKIKKVVIKKLNGDESKTQGKEGEQKVVVVKKKTIFEQNCFKCHLKIENVRKKK
jgi:hypothetical protein